MFLFGYLAADSNTNVSTEGFMGLLKRPYFIKKFYLENTILPFLKIRFNWV